MKKDKPSSISKMRKNFSVVAVLTVLFCICIFTIIQFIFMDDIYTFKTKLNMIEAADEIVSIFNDDDFITKIADYEAENNLYIEIYNPKDTLVYTTDSNNVIYEPSAYSENKSDIKPRIMKIISRTQRDDSSYFEIRQEHFATAKYIVYGNFYGKDTVIELYYPIEVINENSDTASWTVFALSMFALILISVTAFTFATSFTKPLKVITASTKRMASMDFNEKCPEFAIKELNELSFSINTLSISLDSAMSNLKDKNRQLERNIEKELRLEKQRKSFVANVSHELKTPISIIQGYAEGMKYGIGCDSTEEFCDIIIDEANKMNNLVLRLMEFVQYGENYIIKVSKFNLKNAINDYIHSFEQQIQDNDIRLKIEIDSDLEVEADKDLFNDVLNNYVSNALNHISKEKDLIIRAEDNIDKCRVYVFNSGNPISGSDIENIWQSFYRADKAHSRKDGHFGLGLSIVATLQELHGEKYGVSNLENGVEFWFDVKKSIRTSVSNN